MIKKLLLISLLSLATVFASTKVVLQLSWLHQFQFAGFYIAKELGYYRDVGLEVEIKPFTTQTDISNAIASKKADFAIGRSSLLIDKIQGKDIVVLGAIYNQSPLILLVREDSGIRTIHDLKNKKIMLTKDAKESASIMAMLFSHGLSEQDIQIIPHSFNLDDLIHKKTDAMASYISNEPIRLKNQNINYKIFNPKNDGFRFYGDLLFTSSEYIKAHPQVTHNFYKASMKGWEYAFTHILETAELIHQHYNTQGKTLVELIKEGEALKPLAHDQERPIGYLDRTKLENIVNVYKLLGLVKKDVNLKDFIYEHNHPKEFAFSLDYDDIFHLSIVGFFLIILLGAGLLFISIRKQWLLTKRHLKEQIAYQKETIDEQQQTIIAQSKISAVGEMLSNISHQWRQPLNIITLNTAKLETDLLLQKEITHENISHITHEINQQAQYLSQTIDDFRNYFTSKTDTIAPFNVADAISSVHALSKDAFKHHHIETILTLDTCEITNNLSMLVQALLNIFNNAKDAINEAKSECKYLFVDLSCLEHNAIITIQDSGGGIDTTIISKIFEPYYTTKYQAQGTGLGLYITHEIIRKHFKGSIKVTNKNFVYQGIALQGAEFVITIPLKL